MLPIYSVFPTLSWTEKTGGYPRPVLLNKGKRLDKGHQQIKEVPSKHLLNFLNFHSLN